MCQLKKALFFVCAEEELKLYYHSMRNHKLQTNNLHIKNQIKFWFTYTSLLYWYMALFIFQHAWPEGHAMITCLSASLVKILTLDWVFHYIGYNFVINDDTRYIIIFIQLGKINTHSNRIDMTPICQPY